MRPRGMAARALRSAPTEMYRYRGGVSSPFLARRRPVSRAPLGHTTRLGRLGKHGPVVELVEPVVGHGIEKRWRNLNPLCAADPPRRRALRLDGPQFSNRLVAFAYRHPLAFRDGLEKLRQLRLGFRYIDHLHDHH